MESKGWGRGRKAGGAVACLTAPRAEGSAPTPQTSLLNGAADPPAEQVARRPRAWAGEAKKGGK